MERKNYTIQAEKLLYQDKAEFTEFCLKHRSEVDDSFLYDEHLANFSPDEENPTVVVKRDGSIVAAASLILDDYHKRGRHGRFRIFYSEEKALAVYRALLSETVKNIKEIDKIFLFVPLTNNELSEYMKSLHFAVERYVYLLVKELAGSQTINLPDGYSVRYFRPDKDEGAWCHVRNTAFSNLKGSTTPITPEMVRKQLSASEYLEGGMLLLTHLDEPMGIVRGARDDYEGEPAMNIGPLAILPAYQGRGLGTQLLRAALNFAQEKTEYKKAVLCVNAENQKAQELYIREGFVQVEGVVAYEYSIL